MRKRRTREHVIGDLGYNFTERQVLLAGYIMTVVNKDYGYDGIVQTFDGNGEIENRFIFVQVKSTETIFYSNKNKGFSVKLEKKDLENWLDNIYFPVLVVLYDHVKTMAYYICVQEYFFEHQIERTEIKNKFSIFIPSENIFKSEVMMKYRTKII